MLSNLATYIFGASSNEETDSPMTTPPQPSATALPKPSSPSDSEEDWVVVEDGAQPSHLTLGSLNQAVPPPPGGSTGSSNAPSEASEPTPPATNPHHTLSRTDRRLATPFGSCSPGQTTTLDGHLKAVKAVRNVQKSKDKAKAKSLTSKSLEKRNKAVKSNQSKKQYHASLNLCSTNGKQLKQC